VSVLERMLDPYPNRRYPSAEAVLQALEDNGFHPSPGSNPATSGPSLPIPIFNPDGATIAVAPKGATMAAVPSPHPARLRRSNRGSGRAIAKVVLLSGLVIGGWWVGVKWLGPALKSKLPEIVRPSSSNQSLKTVAPKPQSTNFAKAEQDRKQTIEDRRKQLDIDNTVFTRLVNETFFAKHPELNGFKLGTGPNDAGLRAEWDQLALQFLDRLGVLSSAARSRLGQYTEADVRDRQNAASQINLSNRALNDLTDAQFFSLFPEQPRGEKLLNREIGQVWQAIAADQLKALQAGTTLERLDFPGGNLNQRTSGTLKPGGGKAYVANLSQNQLLRLQLQVPNQSVRLSIYPPSSKAPALLEDSKETSWSGKLTEPGFYEIILVSESKTPISFAIDLSTMDEATSSTRPGLTGY
jgi:serine/threonine-protein kinase